MFNNLIEDKVVSLYSLANWQNGLAFRDINFSQSGIPVIKIAELKNGITDQTKFTLDEFEDSVKLHKGDMLFSWSGNPDTSVDIYYYKYESGWLNQHIFKVTAKSIDSKFLYYLLKSMKPEFQRIASNKQTTGLGHVTIADLKRLNVYIPKLKKQQHIVNILGTIDDKIENNEKIISNLLNLANAKYLSFVAKNFFQIKKIDDVFDIAIGRTPPRKENEWFTIEPDGMKWISIADMGKCDGYIFNTSENLTYDAVKSFNIPIIPENTVVLSFKLTVGRIAITTEKMLSNEAIAHFKTDNYKLVPFLYLFLKNYDFNKLGSTSSIATATNSKAVKSINFPLPDANQIDEFYKLINPFFDKIKYLQYVNKKLQETKNLYLKKFFG